MFEHVWTCLNMFEHVWTCLNMFESRFQDQKDITFTLHQQQQMAQSQLGPQEKNICHAFICFLNTFGFDVCTRWEWIACDVTLPLCLLACWLRRQWCDLVWSSSKGLSGWRGRKGPKRGLQELSKGRNWPCFFRALEALAASECPFHGVPSQEGLNVLVWADVMRKLCLYNESCV